MGKTHEEIKAYVFGISPVSGKSVMQEVVEGLTQPLNEQDRKGLTFARTTPRLCEPATEEALQQQFLDNNWTDKLPVVLPTLERVAAMMWSAITPPPISARNGNARSSRWPSMR
jgi:hypothetical protein